jgi:dipeptide/tripeptide permease
MYAGGAIAGLASIPAGVTQATATLHFYTRVFAWLGGGALVSALAATAIIPLLNRLMASPAPSVPEGAEIPGEGETA